MLSELHIENYILLDSLDVTFPEGLIIISGSTGAGKSVILGALGMLSGGKADAASLRDPSRNCVIEATFTGVPDADLATFFEENGVEPAGGEVVIRRVIMPTGRSRAFVNDCPVSVTELPGLCENLFDIHSQHQNLQLASKGFSLNVVDAFAGNEPLVQKCRKAFSRLGSLRSELAEAEEKLRKITLESDYNNAQFEALTAAALKEGELEELETELAQLSNAEDIKSALYSATEAFEPTSDASGVLSMLKDATRSLEKISQYCPSLEGLIERLQGAKYEIEDISSELSSLNDSISLSAERLEWVDQRLGVLYGLLRKYGVESVSELIALRDSLSGGAMSEEELVERIAFLKKEIEAAQAELDQICAELTSSRKKASAKLSGLIEDKLHLLEMASARFEVEVRKAAPSPVGADEIAFMFSATGSALVEASKKASGGELSRIMLAIKSIMADCASLPTIIFDEIDTGISGSVADKMGTMICQMGLKMQVFAITHLPQVAAKGRAHYLVSKSGTDNPVTTMTLIEGEDRISEIARMLSGSRITPEALANARTLL